MTGQQLPALGILLTREVRWFRTGALPRRVLDWFTASGSLGSRSDRIDRYDPVSARRGVGVKQRDSESLEAKFLIGHHDNVRLCPGLEGSVEDWLKISRPVRDAAGRPNGDYLAVFKEIVTRRYAIDPSSPDSGCNAELTAVTIGDQQAWTVCFETFGQPQLRRQALTAGIDGLLGETPIPDGFELRAAESCGYPAWISMVGGA